MLNCNSYAIRRLMQTSDPQGVLQMSLQVNHLAEREERPIGVALTKQNPQGIFQATEVVQVSELGDGHCRWEARGTPRGWSMLEEIPHGIFQATDAPLALLKVFNHMYENGRATYASVA